MTSTKDFLSLHFMVFIWGFTAVLGLLISVSALEIVFFRTGLATIGLALFMLLANKGSFKIPLKSLLYISFIGVAIAAHWLSFFAAGKVANVSIALAGMSTATLWTAILEPIMLKVKPKKLDFIFGIFIIIGLYIIFQFEFDHALGLFLGVLAAFLSAFFSIANFKLIRKYNQYTISLYELASACIITLIAIFIYQSYEPNFNMNWKLSLPDLGWLLILSQICTVYAFTASVEIMKRISAFLVNLTVNLEPIYGIVLAYMIFGESEKMSSGFYFGGIIILISVFSYPILERKLRKPQ